MAEQLYRGRRCWQLENEQLRVTVLQEGGHIAELLDKRTGINPLWTPPWPSIEPSLYSPSIHPEYGSNAESKLLCGIMGHNVCVDLFGAPSTAEAEAGLTVHGESSVVSYRALHSSADQLRVEADLVLAGLRFARNIELSQASVTVEEVVSNDNAYDRPIAYTQHVTLGSPFIVPGETAVDVAVDLSRTYEENFGNLYRRGENFEWPYAPSSDSGVRDLRVYPETSIASGYTAHRVTSDAYFRIATPSLDLSLLYMWQRPDFPWLGIWIENCARKNTPWNGITTTLGMEFGVSPMPETRRKMIERGALFGVPTFRWLEAQSGISSRYSIMTSHA